jgi:hypothetical protein
MKAISMQQPYAMLFAWGALKVDDRPWACSYRGPVAIHASKMANKRYYDYFFKVSGGALPPLELFPYGGIVGVAELVDCLAPRQAGPGELQPDPIRSHFGAAGYFGLVFADARRVPFHACRGSLGLFEAPPFDAD